MTRVDQLRELESHGYSQKRTEAWSEEKIVTVLAARRREARLAIARAEGKAAAIDGARGTASQLERSCAACYIEQALNDDNDALLSMLYAGHCLTTDELKELARHMVRTLRGEDCHADTPAQHEVGTEVVGWLNAGDGQDD